MHVRGVAFTDGCYGSSNLCGGDGVIEAADSEFRLFNRAGYPTFAFTGKENFKATCKIVGLGWYCLSREFLE